MYQGIDPQLAINMVQYSPTIAYDVETTGLEMKDKIIGYVIADSESSVYVPVRHSGGGNILCPDEFERVLGISFKDRARRGYRTIGHNLGFDLRMSAKHGVFPEYPLEDTMINEALINDTTKKYGLDDCCQRRGVTSKSVVTIYRTISQKFGGLPDRKSMAHFHKMAGDDPVVVDYATGDGISTLELWKEQQHRLDYDDGFGNLRVPWKLECELIHRVARIHNRGLKIDAEYGEKLGGPNGIIEQRLQVLQSELPKGFNTNSPKDVEALYRTSGYTDDKFARTETGAPSFTEAWLKNNSIGEKILAIRQVKKARDSFIAPLVTDFNLDGGYNVRGRVHPILNQSKSDEYGVIGSRFSCSDPNLQAFPKRNKDIGMLVRRLVIADSDCEIEEGDAKQQEPRLFAHFSGDERLVDGYRTGTLDIHDLASQGLHLHRDIAKRMAMGMLTMMTPPTLARHMDWDIDTAKKYHREFLTRQFPAIQKFQQDAISVFVGSGFVRSITGRRARYEGEFAYRAVSRIIQNSGGDLMKKTLLRACEYEEANPQIQVLMTIHDSLMWQRQKGFDTTEFVKLLESVPREFNLLVPIPYEVGTGTNWAEASYPVKERDFTPKTGYHQP